jgi:hypothetical protein
LLYSIFHIVYSYRQFVTGIILGTGEGSQGLDWQSSSVRPHEANRGALSMVINGGCWNRTITFLIYIYICNKCIPSVVAFNPYLTGLIDWLSLNVRQQQRSIIKTNHPCYTMSENNLGCRIIKTNHPCYTMSENNLGCRIIKTNHSCYTMSENSLGYRLFYNPDCFLTQCNMDGSFWLFYNPDCFLTQCNMDGSFWFVRKQSGL